MGTCGNVTAHKSPTVRGYRFTANTATLAPQASHEAMSAVLSRSVRDDDKEDDGFNQDRVCCAKARPNFTLFSYPSFPPVSIVLDGRVLWKRGGGDAM